MSGARDSVLGFEVEASHRLFLSQLPTRLTIDDGAKSLVFNSVLIEIDDETQRATSIQRIDREHSIV